MIFMVILIALEFACAVLLVIRSIKGVLEKKRNKVLIISIFGVAVSILLMFFGTVFNTKLELSTMSSINDFVKLFAMK